MLSKIVDADNATQLELKSYTIPSPDEVELIIEDRKRHARRRKVIDTHKEDPLAAAKKEANQILVEAQEKLKDAQTEAAALKNRQEKQIRTKLEKEFQAKMDQQLAGLKTNYTTTLAALGTLKDTIYKQSEVELMEMVFSITRKIIGDEVKTSPQVILSLLQKGFEKIKSATRFEIKIHPGDYQLLGQQEEKIKEMLNTTGSVIFTEDESVERGGCKIVTDSGEISAEPGKQLDIIKKELANGA